MTMAPGIRPFQRKSSFQLLFKIWSYLLFRRKSQFFSSSVSYVFKLLAELMSLGAVIPFLSILSNPETVWNNQSVYRIAYFLGYRDASELVFPITLTFIFFTLLACFCH